MISTKGLRKGYMGVESFVSLLFNLFMSAYYSNLDLYMSKAKTPALVHSGPRMQEIMCLHPLPCL